MKIVIEGCAHGDLDKIYEAIQYLEGQEGFKVDLLICCGDFQATRNAEDLRCMAVPPKFRHMCSFYKYYSGESKAPVLTLFIGGNHEASNHLQELGYGGWAAPNIYYLGYAGVVTIGGVRIAGLSGIYKGHDYMKGHFEKPPYSDNTVRTVYHIRNLEVFRLKQLTRPVHIALSHDWPRGITDYGNTTKLLRRKGFFAEDIRNNRLGSEPAMDLLSELKPDYWFAGHLHCKYPAIVKHGPRQGVTRFLALDKCLPRRKFLQILDISHDPSEPLELRYDLEWLAVLRATNHLLSLKPCITYMPGKSDHERWKFTPTEEEKQLVLERFGGDLKIPLNFTRNAPVYDLNTRLKGPVRARVNPQTTELCARLGIDDPMALLTGGSADTDDSRASELGLGLMPDGPSDYSRFSDSLVTPLDSSADSAGNTPFKRFSMRLPPPKLVEDSDFLSLSFSSQDSLPTTQEMSQTSQETSSKMQETFQTTKETFLTSQETSQSSVSEPFTDVLGDPSNKNFFEEAAAKFSANDNSSSTSSAPKKFKRRNQALYTSTEDED